jgi:uncharacterized membrane protein YdbT with pleckstrin-like domain
MSYVTKNLMNNEEVNYTAKIHWFVYLPGILSIIAGIAAIIASVNNDTVVFALIGLVLFLAGILSFIKAVISAKTTELAVTNKRVIAKVGLIRRETIELNHSKVESYQVNQPILGRIFGYGTITINGTGGGKNPIPNIDSPLEFRKHAVQLADSLQSN